MDASPAVLGAACVLLLAVTAGAAGGANYNRTRTAAATTATLSGSSSRFACTDFATPPMAQNISQLHPGHGTDTVAPM